MPMPDPQTEIILQRLAKQDADLLAYREEREKMDQERADAYGQFAIFVKDGLDKNNRKIDALSDEVQPIIRLTKNVQGFDNVSVWILKALIMVGAGIGVVYGFISWLKH